MALFSCKSWLIASIVWLVVALDVSVLIIGVSPDGFESSEAKTLGDRMENRSIAVRSIRIGWALLNNQPDSFSIEFKPIG